jgi:hypothetical protein
MITVHNDLIQGSDEWLAARCGMITASEMCKLMTPSLKPAANAASRAHLWELAAQRITGHVEPRFVSDAMLRGQVDEAQARHAYAAAGYGSIYEAGFIVNDRHGFRIGYSPDALVGNDGLWECKSRSQRFQVETILAIASNGAAGVPDEFVLQLQTGLLVSERAWIDFTSYCGGLPMVTVRVYPDEAIQAAILETASAAEAQIDAICARWRDALQQPGARLIPTERRLIEEMVI